MKSGIKSTRTVMADGGSFPFTSQRYRTSDDFWPASHVRSHVSRPGASVLDLWWTKTHWNSFFFFFFFFRFFPFVDVIIDRWSAVDLTESEELKASLNQSLSLSLSLAPPVHWKLATFHSYCTLANNWTLGKVDQIYLESFEMCWRRTEKISWTDCIRNKMLLSIKE
jgi:hypothetical protein